MSLISTLKFIIRHPLNRRNKFAAVLRFLKWQISAKFNSFPIVYLFTEKSKLIVEKGMAGATGNMYCGLHEFEDMSFLLHFLRPGDLFIDIGANVGSYTILASAHAGAETISFEPVPSTFSRLVNNISINQLHNNVKAFNIALGSAKGSIDFTHAFDTVNHVEMMSGENTIKVELNTLDAILRDNQFPALIKIDVEGFETEVIKGATKTLRSDQLKAIIIELNGSALRYGYDESLIHETLVGLGFSSYNYYPFTRSFKKVDTFGDYNTLYIKDIYFVNDRIKTADFIKIFNESY